MQEAAAAAGLQPLRQPLGQGLLAKTGVSGFPTPALQPVQQSVGAIGAELSLQCLHGLTALPLQLAPQRRAGLLLTGIQPGKQLPLQVLLQHIDVPAAAGCPRQRRDPRPVQARGELQSGPELAQMRSQPPETDAELMQRFRVLAPQHLGPERLDTAELVRDQLLRLLPRRDRSGHGLSAAEPSRSLGRTATGVKNGLGGSWPVGLSRPHGQRRARPIVSAALPRPAGRDSGTAGPSAAHRAD